MGWLENIVGKGENAGNQHFLLFPQFFQKASFLRDVKSWDCMVKGYSPFWHRKIWFLLLTHLKIGSILRTIVCLSICLSAQTSHENLRWKLNIFPLLLRWFSHKAHLVCRHTSPIHIWLYQGQGHVPRLRSNTEITLFKQQPFSGALEFPKHSLFVILNSDEDIADLMSVRATMQSLLLDDCK